MRSFVARQRLVWWNLFLVVVFGLFWGFLSRDVSAQNIDAKLFDPVTSPYGVMGVHTSRSMRHLSLIGRLSANYANDVLIGRQGSRVVTRPIGQRITTEFGVALGLFDWMEVALSLPLYLRQTSVNYASGRIASGSHSATLLGDLRFSLKGQLLKNKQYKGFGLAVVLEVTLPTGAGEQLAGNGSLTFTPRLVLDYRHQSGLVAAFNFAYRFRGQEKLFGVTIDDELRFAVGAEVPLFFSRLALIGEALFVIGVPQFSYTDKRQSNLSNEFRTGLRWRDPSGIIATLGVGLGVAGGVGAPDYRVFLDIAFGRNVRTGKMEEALPPDYTVSPSVTWAATVSQSAKNPKQQTTPKTRKKRSSVPLAQSNRPVQQTKAPPPKKSVSLPPKAFDQAAASDPDPDGDGIPTSIDKCPNQPEDFDGFQDKDGCPELDNDKDGIPDTKDKCPNQAEVINGIKDDDGCPDKGQSKILLSKGKITIAEKVYFNSGSDKLKPRSFGILRQLASFLKANWQIQKVLIEGHTDSRGDQEMNVDLSERRARRVMAFLVNEGVKVRILTSKGYGSKFPIASNRTAKGRAKNRRVAFKVLKVFLPTKAKVQKGGVQ